MEGDTQKDMILTQVKAMRIREYLVLHFGFNDSQLKTLTSDKPASDASSTGGI
jgi:hypothetical protein